MQHYHRSMDDYVQQTPGALLDLTSHRADRLAQAAELLRRTDFTELILIGSGSSYTAALAAKYFMQDRLQTTVTCLYPNNVLRYDRLFNPKAVVIGISQSGNSVAVINAIEKLRQDGFSTIALTADASSDLPQAAQALIDLGIGEEDCGPKTMGYHATVWMLMLLALEYGRANGSVSDLSYEQCLTHARETFENLPAVRAATLDWYQANKVRLIAIQKLAVVGYGANYATALEGSLKLIEAIRSPSFGYEFEEYLHGPNDDLNQNSTVFLLGTPEEELDRMQRLHTFAGGITDECFLFTGAASEPTRNQVVLPFRNHRELTPLEYVVPLQYLAYRISADRGIDLNTIAHPEYFSIMNSKTRI